MTKQYIEGKVVAQSLFFTEKGELADVQNVQMRMDVCGYYYIIAKNTETRNWRRCWEEIDIKKVAEGIYHIDFISHSSQHIIGEPFMTLEMTKQQVIDWHTNDVWFREELAYLVRRVGKKFYKKGTSKRCIDCRYLVGEHATECNRCAGEKSSATQEGDDSVRTMTVEEVKNMLPKYEFEMFNKANGHEGEMTTLDEKDISDIIFDMRRGTTVEINGFDVIVITYPNDVCKLISRKEIV